MLKREYDLEGLKILKIKVKISSMNKDNFFAMLLNDNDKEKVAFECLNSNLNEDWSPGDKLRITIEKI